MRERPILFSGPMVRAIIEGRKTQTRRLVKPQPSFPFGVKQIVRVLDPWHNDALARTPAEGMGNTGPRLHKWHCEDYAGNLVSAIDIKCPYGSPGDRLWVREKWRSAWHEDLFASVQYAADSSYRKPEFDDEDEGHRFAYMCEVCNGDKEPWRSPLHMWREMSRITLEVTAVRVEQLHEISEADAIAEGVQTERDHYGGDVPLKVHGSVAWHRYDGAACAAVSAVESYRTLWESINGKGAWDENPWVWVVEFNVVEARK